MISRRTAKLLGELFQFKFQISTSINNRKSNKNDLNKLYDFLYENEYASWFCNLVKGLPSLYSDRAIKEFIMKLHTGETQYAATKNWDWEQRKKLGQSYLVDLSEDIINYNSKFSNNRDHSLDQLLNSLSLDGYEINSGKLIFSEIEVLNTKEEAGLLETLYLDLNLDNSDTVIHHLKLSTDHFTIGNWNDSISNSRNFLEATLREIASACSRKLNNSVLSKYVYESPREIRSNLQQIGLLEPKEQKAIASLYTLLSTTGSHPYIARKDEARLMRNLALTMTHFVLLRYKGLLEDTAS